ncbi:hypothetical protein TI04_03390 [Achromatium sp. WMS2]|nr:hypothetical protein TI04_03390 [Achromatium sp. WMS2]
MQECIFCKIISGVIKTDLIYADDHIVAFKDISPQAPVHILIIPKLHISTLNDTSAEHQNLLGHIMLVAKQLANKEGIAESGYRTIMNCNADGEQSVFHIHLHLLGGKRLGGRLVRS